MKNKKQQLLEEEKEPMEPVLSNEEYQEILNLQLSVQNVTSQGFNVYRQKREVYLKIKELSAKLDALNKEHDEISSTLETYVENVSIVEKRSQERINEILAIHGVTGNVNISSEEPHYITMQ